MAAREVVFGGGQGGGSRGAGVEDFNFFNANLVGHHCLDGHAYGFRKEL